MCTIKPKAAAPVTNRSGRPGAVVKRGKTSSAKESSRSVVAVQAANFQSRRNYRARESGSAAARTLKRFPMILVAAKD